MTMQDHTFTYLGLTFLLTSEQDTDHGAPWEEEDGHGPVRELCRAGYSSNGHYRNMGKGPGEIAFSSGERYATIYAYDVQAATKTARAEWGLSDDKLAALRERIAEKAMFLDARTRNNAGGKFIPRPVSEFMREPTKGEIAAEAARLDFEHVRGWVRDEWAYHCLKVELCDVDGETVDGEAEYLGGVCYSDNDTPESIAAEYGEDMAHELASRFGLVTAWRNGKPSRANNRKFITQGAARIRVRD
jgi:hypothetical protein